MSAPSAVLDAVDPYLKRAVSGDAPSAVRLVLALLDGGASQENVIVDLLAAAQREVGERWLRDEWSVADEHIASGVTQRALDAVANASAPRPSIGSVVVACAEGDWHSLPAQMGAEILRDRGWTVSFLGASTPADHVVRLLERDRPRALVVNCNLAIFFSGVARLVDVAHRVGVPVMAGGRAISSLHVATRLGADLWASDIGTAADHLSRTPHAPADGAPSTSASLPALQLDLESPRLADAALRSMLVEHPFMQRLSEQQLARTSEDLAFIVRFVAASLLVDDAHILTEFLGWLDSLLRFRNVPAAALSAGLEALIPVIADIDHAAGNLTRSVTEATASHRDHRDR